MLSLGLAQYNVVVILFAFEVNNNKPYMGAYLINPRAKQDCNDVLDERKGFLQQAGCEAWAGPALTGKT